MRRNQLNVTWFGIRAFSIPILQEKKKMRKTTWYKYKLVSFKGKFYMKKGAKRYHHTAISCNFCGFHFECTVPYWKLLLSSFFKLLFSHLIFDDGKNCWTRNVETRWKIFVFTATYIFFHLLPLVAFWEFSLGRISDSNVGALCRRIHLI